MFDVMGRVRFLLSGALARFIRANLAGSRPRAVQRLPIKTVATPTGSAKSPDKGRRQMQFMCIAQLFRLDVVVLVVGHTSQSQARRDI